MVDDEQWGEDGAGDGHSKGARRGMPTYGQEDAIYARPKTIEDDLRDRVDTHAAADPGTNSHIIINIYVILTLEKNSPKRVQPGHFN